MEPASAHAGAPAPTTFTDGFGVRRRTTDPARHEPIELLCLRAELTAVPSFEFALRERVSHLASFRRGCYANVRSVERLKNPPSALVLVSDVTAGVRLSDLLAFAENATVPLDIDAALCLLRQIAPAVAMLHEQMPDVAHGAIAPQRIVVTPNARIVMVEHVLGAAVHELQFTRERYWKELRVAVPGGAGPIAFDQRSDVAQLGAVALALILGRPLADDELPARLGDVVASSWAISARGGLEPLPAGLRAWLMRALQLDPRESFASATEAHEDLESVLGDSDYLAAPASLEAFLGHFREQTGVCAEPEPVAHREPTAPRSVSPLSPAASIASSTATNPSPTSPTASASWAAAAPASPVSPTSASVAPTTSPIAVPTATDRPAHAAEPSRAADSRAAAPSSGPTPIYEPPAAHPSAFRSASASMLGSAAASSPASTPGSSNPSFAAPASKHTSAAPASTSPSSTAAPPTVAPPHAAFASSASHVPSSTAPVSPVNSPSSPAHPSSPVSAAPSAAFGAPPAFASSSASGSSSVFSPSAPAAPSAKLDQPVRKAEAPAAPVVPQTTASMTSRVEPAAPPLASAVASHASSTLKAEPKAGEPSAFESKSFDPKPAERTSTPIDFSAFDEPAPEPARSPKKWWPAVAGIVVIALAGVTLPAARKLVLPSAAPSEGTLNVTTNPPGARLFVDGVEKGATPLTVALKPGAHSLEVRGDGAPRLMPVTITAGAQVSQYLDLPKAAADVGQLQVRTEPAGARVSVDGIARGAAPVTIPALAPGEHQVLVESDLGTVKQMVVVEAGITASLTVPLGAPEGAPVSGWVTLSAPADLQIFENKRLIGTSQTERLMVSAGKHELELVNDALGYRAVRTVQVAAGKVTAVKVEFPKGTIAINAVPWAEVWVDGEKIGETPIGNLSMTIGTHDVVFRHPDLGEQRHKATVTLTAPARLSVDLRKK